MSVLASLVDSPGLMLSDVMSVLGLFAGVSPRAAGDRIACVLHALLNYWLVTSRSRRFPARGTVVASDGSQPRIFKQARSARKADQYDRHVAGTPPGPREPLSRGAD